MKKILLATCMMFLVFGFSGIASANLITNGSFEGDGEFPAWLTLPGGNTSINGWNVGGNSIDWIGSYWVASDGNRSLDLSGFDKGSISQTFSTDAGATYEVTFDLAGNPYQGETRHLEVSAAGKSQPYDFNTFGYDLSNMGWTPATFIFTGTGADVTLAFTSLDGGVFGPAIDNVSVAASHAPEPATMLLLGTGLIGLAGIGRKKFFNKAS